VGLARIAQHQPDIEFDASIGVIVHDLYERLGVIDCDSQFLGKLATQRIPALLSLNPLAAGEFPSTCHVRAGFTAIDQITTLRVLDQSD